MNAKHKDGKFYGAFVSFVNTDGTYEVYFPCDADNPGKKVKHEDIKLPFMSERQINYGHWDKFIGKQFFDEGTKSDEEEDVEAFEAGEFVVKRVMEGNNYSCQRIGTEEVSVFDIGYVIKRVRKYEEE